jgi:hypothetical protein
LLGPVSPGLLKGVEQLAVVESSEYYGDLAEDEESFASVEGDLVVAV